MRSAAQAIVFERSIVPMATTLPTHTSLFTATQPLEHGVLANSTQGGSRFVPSARLRSLAQVAGAAGWRTAGVREQRRAQARERDRDRLRRLRRAARRAARRRGDHRAPRSRGSSARRRARSCSGSTTSTRIGRTLRRRPTRRCFTSSPRAGGRDRRAGGFRARCSGRSRTRPRRRASRSTSTTASFASRTTSSRGCSPRSRRGPTGRHTVVVIAGDHGEGLGQHGEAAHGGTWEEQLHAPLLMRIPGETPRRVATLVADGRRDPDPARAPPRVTARGRCSPRRAGATCSPPARARSPSSRRTPAASATRAEQR